MEKEYALQDFTAKIYMNIKNPWTILLIIIACFIALQMVNFGHRWVVDESWYLMPIPTIYTEGSFRIPSIPKNDVFWPQPPILTYLEAVIDGIAPLSPQSARGLPLLIGCLTVLTIFLLGKTLFNAQVGLIAAGMVAADNLIFLASRTVRPEILILWFLLLAVLLLYQSHQSESSLAKTYMASLAAALAVSSHPNGLMAPASAGLFMLLVFPLDKQLILRLAHFSLGFFIFILPLVAWVIYFDGPEFKSFQHSWLGRWGRNSESDGSFVSFVSTLLVAEWNGRYADFIQFPFRLHIALVSAALIVVAVVKRDKVQRAIALLVIFQLLFFIFVNNAALIVRYLTTAVPLVALLGGYWTWKLYSNKTRLSLLTTAVIVLSLGVSQVAGNAIYLWQYRDADYLEVGRQLDAIIPDNSTIYGNMTFWLALRDHTFIHYRRTPWKKAVDYWQPDVVIMNDWTMTGQAERHELRQELYAYIEDHGELLGEVKNGFYGDLEVYKISYD